MFAHLALFLFLKFAQCRKRVNFFLYPLFSREIEQIFSPNGKMAVHLYRLSEAMSEHGFHTSPYHPISEMRVQN